MDSSLPPRHRQKVKSLARDVKYVVCAARAQQRICASTGLHALFSPETVSKTISVEEKRAYLQSEFDRHSADTPLCSGVAVVTLGLLQSRDLNQQFTRHASSSYSVGHTLLPGCSEDDRHLEGECSGMCTPPPSCLSLSTSTHTFCASVLAIERLSRGNRIKTLECNNLSCSNLGIML